MCVSPEIIKVKEYMLNRFDSCFSSCKGKRIALYPGECLEDVLRHFDREYHFCCVMELESTKVPPDTDMVIMTNFRGVNETDYKNISRSCEENGIPLMDLFGIDQIGLHRELDEQEYLTMAQWKELLSEYEVISVSVPWAAADRDEQLGRWVIRSRFMVIYRWMQSVGKTIVFFHEDDEQVKALEAEQIDAGENLIRRRGKARGYLQLLEKHAGEKIIHIGTDTVVDGIVPREYGIDSRLIRYYSFSNDVNNAQSETWVCLNRDELKKAIDLHDVISFDIFDTLIKRTLLQPGDVFEIVEAKTNISGFAKCRYDIQTEFPHSTLDEIYLLLEDRCGLDSRTAEMLRQSELETERDVTMARSSMVDIYDYAKKQGKKLVLVSDMYLDTDFLEELLSKNGITGYSSMLISCRYGKLKHEGLYEELIRAESSAGRILHIGDNYYSDYLCALDFGLDAFHVPSCSELARKCGYEKAIEMCRTLTDKKILGLAAAMGFDDPFGTHPDTMIADMILGPLIMGYLFWICKKMAGRGYDAFLLSSRDGWILLDAYDRLSKINPGRLPEGKYFYTSRHAAYMADSDVSGYYRENYRKYIERESLSGKKCAIMDFVSEGSSQRMLEQVTGPMDGFYVGIPEYVSRYTGNISYYFDQDLLDYDTEMKIEVYFTSMEPALDHMGEEGLPVFAEEVRKQSFLDRISKVHEQIRQYLNKYIDCLYEPKDEADKDMTFELCRTINNYEVENYYYDDMSGQEIKTRA